MPVRLTVWGLPGALSLKEREALLAPATVGANVTFIVQFAPGETLAQSPDALNSVWFAGRRRTPETARVAFPVLLRVTVCCFETVLSTWLPNETEGGEKLIDGVPPPPPPPPPLPPPQAAHAPTNMRVVAKTRVGRRRPTIVTLSSVASASHPAKNQSQLAGNRNPAGGLRATSGDALVAAVVLTLSVAVAEEEPVRFTEEVESEHTMLGSEAQVRPTDPVNPPREVTLSVVVPDCPGAEILRLVGLNDTL